MGSDCRVTPVQDKPEAGLPETVIRFHTREYNIGEIRQRDLELLDQVGFPPAMVEKARPYLPSSDRGSIGSGQ